MKDAIVIFKLNSKDYRFKRVHQPDTKLNFYVLNGSKPELRYGLLSVNVGDSSGQIKFLSRVPWTFPWDISLKNGKFRDMSHYEHCPAFCVYFGVVSAVWGRSFFPGFPDGFLSTEFGGNSWNCTENGKIRL